jgi:sugar phosphate isomerase/epimerase
MKAPFGVSQYTTWTQSFEQDIVLYRKLGIEYIEVCEGKLKGPRFEGLLRSVPDAGLTVSSVQPRYHSPYPNSLRASPAEPAERMKLLAGSVRLFARHFPGTTLVVNTGLAPRGDLDSAYRVAIREFRRISQIAAGEGVRIALEPLNPVYMNTDTFVASLAHARRMIDAVEHASFGLFLDLWHIWEEGDSASQIRRFGDQIFGVHISDWRLPRASADRLLPGDGDIPIVPLLKAARRGGYTGACTLEIFSDLALRDSLWRHPRRTVAAGQRGFAKIWRRVCA